jgi:hypothetical protein
VKEVVELYDASQREAAQNKEQAMRRSASFVLYAWGSFFGMPFHRWVRS